MQGVLIAYPVMKLIAWRCFLLGFLSVALSTELKNPHGGSESVVKPEVIIPDVWKVNGDDTLLFLHLDIPCDFPLERVKIMSNGEQILVIATDQAKEKPETKAMNKYKLILDALKQQAGYDEELLMRHLGEWYETEEDDEVRVLVKSAIDSLKDVRDAKMHESGPPPAQSIPLGMLVEQVSKRNASSSAKAREVSMSFLAAAAPHGAVVDSTMKHAISHMVTATNTSATAAHEDQNVHKHLRIIKESFAVEIPFPVSAQQVFVLQTPDKDLVVTMPVKRNSLEAQGISTGGKPFTPCAIYNLGGQLIGGADEAPDLYSLAPNLSDRYFMEPNVYLKPLESE